GDLNLGTPSGGGGNDIIELSDGSTLTVEGSMSVTGPNSKLTVKAGGGAPSTLIVGTTLTVEGAGQSIQIKDGSQFVVDQSAAIGVQTGSTVNVTIDGTASDGAPSRLSVGGDLEIGGGVTVAITNKAELDAGVSGKGVLTVESGATIQGDGD